MATSTLRPLTVGEILDAAVVVVTRHWKPLLGSLLLVSTPIWAIFILLIASIDASVFELDSSSTTTEDPTGNAIAGLGVITLLLMVVFLVSFIAVFKGVCDAWVGANPRMSKSLGFGVRRAGWVLLLTLIWLPSITAFSMFCGIPAFWLGTVWCLSIPAMLFERLGPFRALGRSFSLIRGRFWEALVVVLVITAAYYVLSYVVSIPILGVAVLAGGDNGVTNAIAYGVAGLAGSVVTVPYIASLLTILYFDQRVRKEGFDIQLLAAGGRLDPDAPLPAPLVAPAGFVVPPPPPPPQWQSTGGWTGPAAGEAPPLRWGPAAEPAPPPASAWTPPGSDAPPGDGPSPWMTPDGAAPPGDTAHPGDTAPPGDPAPPGDTAPPAEDAPSPWMTPGGAAPPAADDAPPAPEEPRSGWSPTPWQPTEWKPDRKDPEGPDER